MATVRVHEMARELGVDSSEFMPARTNLGRPAKSDPAIIEPEDASRLRSQGSPSPPSTRTKFLGRVGDPEHGKCPCCLRDDRDLYPPKTPDDLPADRSSYICRPCTQHSNPSGSREAQRNRSHVLLYTHDAQDELQARQRSFEEELARLRRELEERPVVELDHDQELVDRYKMQTRSALSSRDHAYADLLTVKLMHRQQRGTKCSCGRDNCPTARLFFDPSGLDRWEAEQVDRLRRHKPHSLPDNHPAVLDRRRANNWE